MTDGLEILYAVLDEQAADWYAEQDEEFVYYTLSYLDNGQDAQPTIRHRAPERSATMKRYIANITVSRPEGRFWTTQMFTAWPSRCKARAQQIAREFCDGWSHATVTSIEEVPA